MILAEGTVWPYRYRRGTSPLIVWGPLYFMFVKFNVFLMIVALLPIGPFDGHDAWKIIPRAKRKAKPRIARARTATPDEPVVILDPQQQRELDESSEKEAADLMARLTRKSDAPTQDR